MTDDRVKGRSGRRERNARATRQRVLDAAERLFVRDGFAATTIAAVATAADVAEQTVYAVFGNKRALLTELLNVRVVGDDQQLPLSDREEWRAMEMEPDARRQLALLADIATHIGERMAAIYEVLAAAAASDPAIAALYEAQQQARYRDQSRVAHGLAQSGALRSDLSEQQATDILWAIANPRTFGALVGERGWPTEAYAHWLGRLLASALLADPEGQR
jgi:AcrR family transcriptional regulator